MEGLPSKVQLGIADMASGKALPTLWLTLAPQQTSQRPKQKRLVQYKTQQQFVITIRYYMSYVTTQFYMIGRAVDCFIPASSQIHE